MTQKTRILTAASVGVVWSVALLAGSASFLAIPVFALIPTIMTAFFAPGLILTLMVARLVLRRFVHDARLFDPREDRGEQDRRVVQETAVQMVLAAAMWPAAAVLLGPNGPGAIMALGIGFSISSVVFWIGCHRGPFLEMLGTCAMFFPTVVVAIWAVSSFVL